MPKPVGDHRRHPACGQCGYDLWATVEAGHRRCPECGEEFEPHDLRIMPRDDDWTPMRGFAGAAKMLALKSIIIAVLLGATVLAMEWLSVHVPWQGNAFAMLAMSLLMFVAIVALGYATGRAIASGLIDAAGTGGVAVAVVAVCFAMLALAAGVTAAHLIQPFGTVNPIAIIVIMTASSCFPIVRTAILEEL